MKADAARIAAIAARWPADVRLVLLYGPDESASADMAAQIARQFANADNPMAVETLAGAILKDDPQALVAAAGAVSMFGDRTLVRVDGMDDEAADAVAALLGLSGANPVLATAGALKKGSKLAALAERAPQVAAVQSYQPGLRDAQRLVTELAQPLGLRVARDLAVALFESTGGERMVMRRELEKLSLYLDSDTDRVCSVEAADLSAIGVMASDIDQYVLVAAAVGGRPRQVVELMGRIQGVPGIPLLRALDRRLGLLLGLRGVVDGGGSVQAAVDGARPPIFWKEKDAIVAELAAWPTAALAQAMGELLAAERAIKSSGSLGETIADAAIVRLARRAASLRAR